jgi:acetolactate synthase-1/3 small subunit
MTFTVDGATTNIEQVVKQMLRIIEVHSVVDLTDHDVIHREIALVKVAASEAQRGMVIETAEIFQTEVLDTSPKALVLEITGTEDKVDAFLQALKPFGIIELVRTGRVAMTCGPEASLHK